MTPQTPRPAAFRPSARLMKNLLRVSFAGTAVTLVGLFVAPGRTWPNILLASYYVLGLSVGAAVFIALQYVSNAGWSVALRRVPEAVAVVFPLGAALILLVLPGIQSVYEWSHAEVAAASHLLSAKSGWLNIPFFALRTVVYLAVWGLLIRKMIATSRQQDAERGTTLTLKNRRFSAAFIAIFAFTFTLASMDWIMTLEPEWYSTIFGIYNFSGVFLSGLAMTTVIVIVLKRSGGGSGVITETHLLNMGKYVFAFSTFWMYIWFSQYLLIWYANIPEEVVYLVRRQEGSWVIFTVVNVVFNWLIPFVVLLPRWTKRNEGLLLKVCIIILIGHWIDLFWMILPPFMAEAPVFNLWEIAPLSAALPLFFMLVLRTLSRHSVVPTGDPLLAESLHLH